MPLSYDVQEGILQLLGGGDVISHYRGGTYPVFSGHDRFTVTQQNLSLAQIYSGTSPRDRGVIAHSIFAGSLPQPILGLLTTLQSHTQSGRSQVFTPLPGG